MKKCQMIFEVLLLTTAPMLAQYDAIKPDVTFGDHNERFDVSDIMSQQNRYFRSDDSIDYRRSHGTKRRHKFLRNGANSMDKWILSSERGRKKFAQRVKKETQDELNKLANIILLRMNSFRRARKYPHHDNMEDDGGDIYDFNENLAVFQKVERKPEKRGGNKKYRRIGTDPEMLNYAFPIDMKVKGYLILPENQ